MLRETGSATSVAPRALAHALLLTGLVVVLWLLTGTADAHADEQRGDSDAPGRAVAALVKDDAKELRGAVADRVRDAVQPPADRVEATADDVVEETSRTVARTTENVRRTTEVVRESGRDATDVVRKVVDGTRDEVDRVVEEATQALPPRPVDETEPSGRTNRDEGESSSRQGDSRLQDIRAQRNALTTSRLDAMAPRSTGVLSALVVADGAATALDAAPATPAESPVETPARGCAPVQSFGASGAAPLGVVTTSDRASSGAGHGAPVAGAPGGLRPAPGSSPGCTPD